MKPETITKLVQLFVSVPLMIDSSKRQKNKYLKKSMAIGGTVLAGVIIYQILQEAEKKRAAKL